MDNFSTMRPRELAAHAPAHGAFVVAAQPVATELGFVVGNGNDAARFFTASTAAAARELAQLYSVIGFRVRMLELNRAGNYQEVRL